MPVTAKGGMKGEDGMRWLRDRQDTRGGNEGGFTLIELLVVVGILAVLAAIAAPRITEVINKSKEARSKADLKVISGALERYYSDNNKYPEKLDDLKAKGYIKFDVTFKNAHNKYYLYAIDATGTPVAYLLMDPGGNPSTDATPTVWLKVTGVSGASDRVPEGKAPDQTAYVWGPSATLKFKDVTGADLVWNVDANDPSKNGFLKSANEYTRSVGAYCMAKTTCRTDLSTD